MEKNVCKLSTQDYFGFTKAIGNRKQQQTIKVTFVNGRAANYSKPMFSMLKTETAVLEIMDNETGEILYSK